MTTDTALEPRSGPGFALTFGEMVYRVQELDRFYREVMQQGTDYDTIPGTPKPTLLQPGAQMLDAIFGLAPRFDELPGTIRDYENGFFAYEIACRLVSKATGDVLAEGIGSCNSKEGRYRWRDARPTCPACGFELRVSKGRPEWYCWRQKGGCGKTYPLDAIQATGRVENDDPYTLANTILKMAQKRAHVAATLNATGASRIFTQDVEDLAPVIDVAPAPVARRVTPTAEDVRPAVTEEEQRRADAATVEPPDDWEETVARVKADVAKMDSDARKDAWDKAAATAEELGLPVPTLLGMTREQIEAEIVKLTLAVRWKLHVDHATGAAY
jgi:hypothetical protein